MGFFFYFADLNYKIIYPVLLGLTSACIYVVKKYFSNYSKTTKDEFGEHYFFFYWLMFLAESSAGFCFLIKQSIFPVKINNNYQPKLKFFGIHIIFYLFLAILDLSSEIINQMTDDFFSNTEENCFNAFQVIVLIFLCKIILHYKYYTHHGVGLGLELLGFVVLSLSDLSKSYKELTYNCYLFITLSLIVQIIFSIQECIEKYVMDTLFFDPFMLLSGEGICGLIIVSILFFFLNDITCIDNSYNICLGKGKKVEDFIWVIKYLINNPAYFIYYFLLFVLLLAFNCLKMVTTQHFTPLHRYIGKDLRYLLILILSLVFPSLLDNNKQNVFILLSGIGYILQFIGDLIFLEIIILNFCGLKNNTKPEVIKRDIENNDLKAIFDNESFSVLSENNLFE